MSDGEPEEEEAEQSEADLNQWYEGQEEATAFPDNSSHDRSSYEYLNEPEAWESPAGTTGSLDGQHQWTEEELNLL